MDVPLVHVFLPVVGRQDDTLTLMQSKDITEIVLTRLIYHLIFCVHLIGVNECRMGLLLKLELGKGIKRCCVILLVHFKFTIISAIVLIANRQVAVNSIMRLLLDHSVWINNSIELAKAVIVWALVKLRVQIFGHLTRESLLILILGALSASCFEYIDIRLFFLSLRGVLKMLIWGSSSNGGCFDVDLITTAYLPFCNHVLVVCFKLYSEISVGQVDCLQKSHLQVLTDYLVALQTIQVLFMFSRSCYRDMVSIFSGKLDWCRLRRISSLFLLQKRGSGVVSHSFVISTIKSRFEFIRFFTIV